MSSASLPATGGKIRALLGEEISRIIETIEKALTDPNERKIPSATTIIQRSVKNYRSGFLEVFHYLIRVGNERFRPIARVEIKIVIDGRYA